jgi:hypothetical protein
MQRGDIRARIQEIEDELGRLCAELRDLRACIDDGDDDADGGPTLHIIQGGIAA